VKILIWSLCGSGERELITPPLDGTILPGVTRKSILELAHEWNEFKVTEAPFTMTQVVEALHEGRVHISNNSLCLHLSLFFS
jgi:branched-chain amino acid aminotransferase